MYVFYITTFLPFRDDLLIFIDWVYHMICLEEFAVNLARSSWQEEGAVDEEEEEEPVPVVTSMGSTNGTSPNYSVNKLLVSNLLGVPRVIIRFIFGFSMITIQLLGYLKFRQHPNMMVTTDGSLDAVFSNEPCFSALK